MGSKNSPGNPQPQHERILRWSHMKQTEILHSETVIVGGRLVLSRVVEKFVPYIQRVLLIFPTLFLRHFGDRYAEPGLFCRLRIDMRMDRRGGIVGDKPAGCFTGKGKQPTLRDTSKETLQVFFLLACEG